MAIITHRNLVINSIDSRILAIWCHGSYLANTRQTTIPATAKVIWHAAPDNYGILPKGARYITGSRSQNDLQDWGVTEGGLTCLNYTLLTQQNDPSQVAGQPTVDYLTTKPGKSEQLSALWEAMATKGLDYQWIHYFACRVRLPI